MSRVYYRLLAKRRVVRERGANGNSGCGTGRVFLSEFYIMNLYLLGRIFSEHVLSFFVMDFNARCVYLVKSAKSADFETV